MDTRNVLLNRVPNNWRNRTIPIIAAAAIFGLLAGTNAWALPDNGQGPLPPIGGGGLDPGGPTLPPGVDPCNPPQLPPGIWVPSFAHGRLRETCGGVLRPVANQPVKVILHTQYQGIPCNGGPIPAAVFNDTEVASGQTDTNGAFDIEFDETLSPFDTNDFRVTTKVRIVAYDDSGVVPIWQTAYYGDNGTQVFDVFEDVNYCLTEGTRIRVVSPNGTGAFDAEVFVDGVLYPQRTNASGFITINPPLAAGSEIVARAMVGESKSDRSKHNQGSSQNWKYRAYVTSLPLEYDANGDNADFTPMEVTDPNGAYELRLNRDASYIGLHLVGSIEWDASPSELSSFETKMRRASRYMFNATDGQMLIERVDVFDDRNTWDEADFRVYADASLRANVDWPSDGFWRSHDLCCWRSSHMNISRSNDHPVYDHEFGHYGFRLGDEYEDNGGDHCAAGVGGSIPEFDAGGDKASCMMFYQWDYTKICSHHSDNPHQGGTSQGSEDCWSAIKRQFTAEAPGPNGVPRWHIRTPDDRGVIVGRLPGIPVSDWEAQVVTHDFNNGDLCQPVQFQWANNNQFAAGARVFSRDSRGRMIIQGTTDATGVIKPFQDNVTTVAGLHVGDTIGAMWYRYGNNGYSQFFRSRTFSEDDCMSAMVVLAVVPGQAPPAPQKFFVDGESLSFPLAAQIEPGATIGDVVVRVRAGDELDGAPIVRVSIDREDDPRDVAMEFDAATGEWVGDVHGLPDQCFVNAEVQGADADGRKANIISQATLTGAVDDEDSEIASADGAVRLSIPEGAFAEPTQIVIGGSIAPLPDDFPGQIVVGPIGVTTNGAEPALAAVLSFPLRFDSEAALLEQLDPTMLIVLAFDETTGLWNEIDATYHSGKLAVDAQVAKFGAFVLLDRGAVPASGQQGDDSSPADASGTPDNRAPDSPVAPAADCGTGVFGSSMAMASPLMLVLAGVRRRRCRNVIA